MRSFHQFRLKRLKWLTKFLSWLMFGLLIAGLGFMGLQRTPEVIATTLSTPAHPIPQTLFGMHVYDPVKVGWPSVAISANRIFYPWLFLEPKDNQWNFAELDKRVEIAHAQGAELIFVLNDTPTWASARPQELGEWGQENLGTAAEPKDRQVWQDLLRTLATRYKGKITAYQIWNEPNNSKDYSGSIEKIV